MLTKARWKAILDEREHNYDLWAKEAPKYLDEVSAIITSYVIASENFPEKKEEPKPKSPYKFAMKLPPKKKRR